MNNQIEINDRENNIKTYRRIRKAIGYLGFVLPILLIVLSLIPFFETSVQSSISKYYFTNLREVFTGTLSAVGLFLIRYVGFKSSSFWKNDNLLTNIAGFCAIAVAFIPTNPECWADKIYTIIPYNGNFIGWIHYGFAGLLFLILAYISIRIFPLGQNEKDGARQTSFDENVIYKVCGYLMIGSLVLVPIFSALKIVSYSTLILEALILFAFGISWLIKGRALGDKGKIGKILYKENNLSQKKI